ncbi:MAG: hypothetical protein IKT67_07650 [Lachnospiraceae bacterium]|nr:hypothetical protein [Lachnospiraceae bacterium]
MVKKEKTSKFGKSVLWAVLSYLVISVIAVICSVIRKSVQGEDSSAVTWFMFVELVLFPILFYVAGYLGSKKYEFQKFATYKVWLFSFIFSVALLGLWYVFMVPYVLLNLPAAEGSYALDLFLRKTTVTQEYTVLYLSETDGYKYVILPLVHFVFRFVYWLFYALGNRNYAREQKERERARVRR